MLSVDMTSHGSHTTFSPLVSLALSFSFLQPASKQTNNKYSTQASKHTFIITHIYPLYPTHPFPPPKSLNIPNTQSSLSYFLLPLTLTLSISTHVVHFFVVVFIYFIPCEYNRQSFDWLQKKGEKRRKRKRWESFSDTKSQQWCEHSSTPNKPLFLSVGCSLILQFYGPTTVPKGHSSSATLLAVAFLNVIHGFWSGALIFIDDVDFTFDHPDSFACQEKQEAPRLIARARFFISIVALHCPHEMESKSYTATLRSVLSLFSQPQSNLLEKP